MIPSISRKLRTPLRAEFFQERDEIKVNLDIRNVRCLFGPKAPSCRVLCLLTQMQMQGEFCSSVQCSAACEILNEGGMWPAGVEQVFPKAVDDPALSWNNTCLLYRPHKLAASGGVSASLHAAAKVSSWIVSSWRSVSVEVTQVLVLPLLLLLMLFLLLLIMMRLV